ncbi:MAG: DUF5685 family protein [Clostridiaceae bacterium]
MFGYVVPCKMELKIKDYEIFKAYYCGLCFSIKNKFGNMPRLSLNYDMTFLAILLDSLDEVPNKYSKSSCIKHPFNKRLITECGALNYAAYMNVNLAYFKLLDDVYDDKSFSKKIISKILNLYIKDNNDFNYPKQNIENSISKLSYNEKNEISSLDKIAHPFADLTGDILSFYKKDQPYSEILYYLGYNLGKWIYYIDALDDLKKDRQDNKYNPLDKIFNSSNLSYEQLILLIKERIDFVLINCANSCADLLDQLPIKKNKDILHNILNLGMVEKIDKIYIRSGINEQSI